MGTLIKKKSKRMEAPGLTRSAKQQGLQMPTAHATPDHTADARMTGVWFGAIVLLYIILRIHSLPIPLDRDEGIFGYAGQRISEGGKPYLDVFDHKPPGVFYVFALALKIFPATAIGIHLFLAIYNLFTLLAVALLIRARFNDRRAWLAGAFCYAVFSASPSIQGFTASTEMLMLLPITLSVLLAVVGKKRNSSGLVILSGAAGAGAFWIKQTSATAVGFAVLYLAFTPWLDTVEAEDSVPRRVRDVMLWLLGAFAISGLITSYFYLVGLFREFWYWSFTHNALYTAQVRLSDTLTADRDALLNILRGDFPIVLLGIAAAVWGWRKRTADAVFVTGFLLFSMAGTFPGFGYAHYFAQLAPAVAIAAGWALSIIPSRRSGRPGAAFYLALIAVAGVPLVVHSDYFVELTPQAFSRKFFNQNPFPESEQLSAFLAAQTTESDHIFIFGSEPQILLEAHRKSASPFAMIYPLTRSFPRYL